MNIIDLLALTAVPLFHPVVPQHVEDIFINGVNSRRVAPIERLPSPTSAAAARPAVTPPWSILRVSRRPPPWK